MNICYGCFLSLQAVRPEGLGPPSPLGGQLLRSICVASWIWNYGTLLTSAPDFTESITVRVVDGIKTKIDDVRLLEKIVLYTNESTAVYPKVNPVNADFYID